MEEDVLFSSLSDLRKPRDKISSSFLLPSTFIRDPFLSFTIQYLPTHRGLVPVHCPSIHCLCGDPRSIYPSLQVSCTSSGTVWDTFMRFDPFSGSGTFEKEHQSGESIKEARNPIKISPCKLSFKRRVRPQDYTFQHQHYSILGELELQHEPGSRNCKWQGSMADCFERGELERAGRSIKDVMLEERDRETGRKEKRDEKR